MSEASPYSIDIVKMTNALLPSLSSSFHYFGNDEVQLEILKRTLQMNDQSNSFNMESRVVNNDKQLDKGLYTQPSQMHSMIYDTNNHHQPGSVYAISSSKEVSQQSLLFDNDKEPSLSQYEGVSGNTRKRPFEYIDNMSLWKKMKSSSESKITCLEPKWHEAREASEIIPRNKLQVPMRRNQKLSDKLPTLQKLVSPFGKTDTASVLHEASLYIKHLQAQIRTLFQMLSFSYISTVKAIHNQESGDKLQVDLRSRGLCLVPISFTQKVTMQDQIHHASTSKINLS